MKRTAPRFGPVMGGWRSTIESVNTLITDLASPTSEVAGVLTAVAEGDLGQKMVSRSMATGAGRVPPHRNTVNTMVDQLGSFANEVTRVAREVERKVSWAASGSAGRRWNVRTLRQRQHARRQSDEPGEKHCRGHHRSCQRRPVAEDHGRSPRETLELKNTINTMGRSAQCLRIRSHARRS